MKSLLVCLGVAQALPTGRFKSIAQKLKSANAESTSESETTSMVAGVFDVAGFDEIETSGKIGMKVCTHNPTKIHLSKEAQVPAWTRITEANSPMETGQWKPAANGFRLENVQGEQLHCSAMAGREVVDALLLEFHCEAHDSSKSAPRFAEVATSFWQACPNGHVPYGWPSQWGEFDFPYYAVTDHGFLGCSTVTADGYCIETHDGSAIGANFGYNDSPSNKPVSLFPYDTFSSGDLLPGSRFYTSAQPPRGLVIKGSTTSSQPALYKSEAPNKPSVTVSTQPIPPPPVPDTAVVSLSATAPPFQVASNTATTASAQTTAHRFRSFEGLSTSSPPFVFKFAKKENSDDLQAKADAAARKIEEEEDDD